MASITREEIGLAMSGGVDSTAAALLLKETREVRGFLMDLGQPGFSEQADRTAEIAGRIGIDLSVVDLKEQFEERVLAYFIASYEQGLTPNPCMVCNREIKCGLFLDHILARGAGRMATGHYAIIREIDGEHGLFRGVDRTKDQSYFLARLGADQLARMRLPLGSMHKEETYRFVEARGFTDFRGRESQDVCFLKGMRVADFLHQRLRGRWRPGPFVTGAGEEIGRHRGLHRYTIGQRRGLGLPDHSPWYVRALDAGRNRVVVGRNEDLFSSRLRATDCHWLVARQPRAGDRFSAQVRSTHRGAPATVAALDDKVLLLEFDQPQRALTPGQFVVLYQGDRVVGSARIAAADFPDHG